MLQISNTLWAFATAGITPKYLDIYDNVLVPKEDRFSGPLDRIDDPITLVYGAFAKELMRRPQEFKPQEMKDSLWSFSKVRASTGRNGDRYRCWLIAAIL